VRVYDLMKPFKEVPKEKLDEHAQQAGHVEPRVRAA
jgi:hypothetical protein